MNVKNFFLQSCSLYVVAGNLLHVATDGILVDHQEWLVKTILLKELVYNILIKIVGVLNCLHSN